MMPNKFIFDHTWDGLVSVLVKFKDWHGADVFDNDLIDEKTLEELCNVFDFYPEQIKGHASLFGDEPQRKRQIKGKVCRWICELTRSKGNLAAGIVPGDDCYPGDKELASQAYLHFLKHKERPGKLISTHFPAVEKKGDHLICTWEIGIYPGGSNVGKVAYALHGVKEEGNAVRRCLEDEALRDGFDRAVQRATTLADELDWKDRRDLLVGLQAEHTRKAGHAGETRFVDYGGITGPSGSLALAIGILAAWNPEQKTRPVRLVDILFTGAVDATVDLWDEKVNIAGESNFRWLIHQFGGEPTNGQDTLKLSYARDLQEAWKLVVSDRKDMRDLVEASLQALNRVEGGGKAKPSEYDDLPIRIIKTEVDLEAWHSAGKLPTRPEASESKQERASVGQYGSENVGTKKKETEIVGLAALRHELLRNSFNPKAPCPQIIVGIPGVGKTFLTRSLARQFLSNWRDASQPFVLHISLAEFKAKDSDDGSILKKLIELEYEKHKESLKLPSRDYDSGIAHLEAVCKTEPLVVILDGFDQAPDAKANRILERIADERECKETWVLITTRPIAEQAIYDQFPNSARTTYQAGEFSMMATEQFLGIRLQEEAHRTAVLQSGDRIAGYRAIRVPMLLELLCELAESDGLSAENPPTRYELYEKVVRLRCQLAIETLNRNKAPINAWHLEADDIFRFLGRVALRLWDSAAGQNQCSHEKWSTGVEYEAKKLKQSAAPWKELLKLTGLFDLGVEGGNGRASVVHRTLLEFLRAYQMAQQFELLSWSESDRDDEHSLEKIICRKGWDPQWQEVFTFFASYIADREKDGVRGAEFVPLLKLLTNQEPSFREKWSLAPDPDDLLGHRLALALRCLREAWYLYEVDPPAYSEGIDSWLGSFSLPKTPSVAKKQGASLLIPQRLKNGSLPIADVQEIVAGKLDGGLLCPNFFQEIVGLCVSSNSPFWVPGALKGVASGISATQSSMAIDRLSKALHDRNSEHREHLVEVIGVLASNLAPTESLSVVHSLMDLLELLDDDGEAAFQCEVLEAVAANSSHFFTSDSLNILQRLLSLEPYLSPNLATSLFLNVKIINVIQACGSRLSEADLELGVNEFFDRLARGLWSAFWDCAFEGLINNLSAETAKGIERKQTSSLLQGAFGYDGLFDLKAMSMLDLLRNRFGAESLLDPINPDGPDFWLGAHGPDGTRLESLGRKLISSYDKFDYVVGLAQIEVSRLSNSASIEAFWNLAEQFDLTEDDQVRRDSISCGILFLAPALSGKEASAAVNALLDRIEFLGSPAFLAIQKLAPELTAEQASAASRRLVGYLDLHATGGYDEGAAMAALQSRLTEDDSDTIVGLVLPWLFTLRRDCFRHTAIIFFKLVMLTQKSAKAVAETLQPNRGVTELLLFEKLASRDFRMFFECSVDLLALTDLTAPSRS